MVFGMLIEVFFRKGDDLGSVPIVKADPDPGGSRPSGDLQEPDPRWIEDLLNIVAYLVYLTLICHWLSPCR